MEPYFCQGFVPDYELGSLTPFQKLAVRLLLVDGWGDMAWSYPFRKPGVCNERPLWPMVLDFSQQQVTANKTAPDSTFLLNVSGTIQSDIVEWVFP